MLFHEAGAPKCAIYVRFTLKTWG